MITGRAHRIITKMVIFAVLAMAAFSAASCYERETVEVTVIGKERVEQGSGDFRTSRYLIMTENESGQVEVFENTDSIVFLKMNSSDVQAKAREGKRVRMEVYGYRIPFLSMYRNVVSIERLE